VGVQPVQHSAKCCVCLLLWDGLWSLASTLPFINPLRLSSFSLLATLLGELGGSGAPSSALKDLCISYPSLSIDDSNANLTS
jgi:hypothetical protein